MYCSSQIRPETVVFQYTLLCDTCRLAAVSLTDAHLCSDPGKYLSALLQALSSMLHLELPHINVLSKIDLIEQYGKLAFNLDFYTEASLTPVQLEHKLCIACWQFEALLVWHCHCAYHHVCATQCSTWMFLCALSAAFHAHVPVP